MREGGRDRNYDNAVGDYHNHITQNTTHAEILPLHNSDNSFLLSRFCLNLVLIDQYQSLCSAAFPVQILNINY